MKLFLFVSIFISFDLYADTSLLCESDDLYTPIINQIEYTRGEGFAKAYVGHFSDADEMSIQAQDLEAGIYGVEIDVDGKKDFVWIYGREQGDYTDFLKGFPRIPSPIAHYTKKEFFKFRLDSDLFLDAECIMARPVDGCHNLGQWITVYCPALIPMS